MAFSYFIILFGVLTKLAYGNPVQASDPSPFIIGGEDAPIAYAPYMVALIFGDRVLFHFCGGSIISRDLVLTAAHCIEPFILDDGGLLATFHVRIGSNQWNSGGTIAEIKEYYMHPQWDSTNIKYDAAILVLKEQLVLTDKVTVIGLDYDFVDANERSFVTGWGRTGPRIDDNGVHLQPTPDDLQLLYVDTISHDQCQKQMTSIAGGLAPPIQRDVEICTFHSRGHGMCHGDSGSALVRASSNQQIGIVSWGFNCAAGAPDVFARICGIRDFVDPILNKFKTD